MKRKLYIDDSLLVVMVQSREKKNAVSKQYYKDHRDEILAYNKQHYKDHREEKLAYIKQYRKDNSEEISTQKKQHYKDHREEKLAYVKQHYKDHREERKAYMKQYHKDHPEVNFKSNKKRLIKLGKTLDMDYNGVKLALMSWSKTVKKHDNHKCTWCNSTENLIAHHIWHKQWCPESALDVDNGITLCHECHVEQHRLDRSFS